MVDAAGERGAVGLGDAEQRLGEVARDGAHAPGGGRAEPLEQGVEALLRPLAHEHVDVPVALEQPLDQPAPMKPVPPVTKYAMAGG